MRKRKWLIRLFLVLLLFGGVFVFRCFDDYGKVDKELGTLKPRPVVGDITLKLHENDAKEMVLMFLDYHKKGEHAEARNKHAGLIKNTEEVIKDVYDYKYLGVKSYERYTGVRFLQDETITWEFLVGEGTKDAELKKFNDFKKLKTQLYLNFEKNKKEYNIIDNGDTVLLEKKKYVHQFYDFKYEVSYLNNHGEKQKKTLIFHVEDYDNKWGWSLSRIFDAEQMDGLKIEKYNL